MSYARWNDAHKAYDEDVKKSVYELNNENMPVAFKYHHQINPISNLLAIAK